MITKKQQKSYFLVGDPRSELVRNDAVKRCFLVGRTPSADRGRFFALHAFLPGVSGSASDAQSAFGVGPGSGAVEGSRELRMVFET